METQEFGARLRELRKQAGLSQRELADKIGINFTYLSKIESGVMPPPSEKVIQKLAEVLNVDKDELMTLAGKIPADIAQILKNRETLQLLRASRNQKKSREKKGGISMVKHLANYKKFYRIATAAVLVIAVAASLWFASPLPVKALNISFPSLPTTGTLGSTYIFTVKVDIADPELLPIQNINLYIYKADARTTYEATIANLPLNTTTTPYTAIMATGTSGTAGTVSITATSTNWEWFQGYGYALWEGTGYYFGDNVFGYGYQMTGTASITYTVTWTSPANWPEGSYKAEAKITANSTTFTKTSPTTFSLAAEAVEVVAPPPVVPPPVVPPPVVPPPVVPPPVTPPPAAPPVEEMPPEEAAEAIAAMPTAQAATTIEQIATAKAADILEQMATAKAADILEQVATAKAADILEQVATAKAADILEQVATEKAAAVMEKLTTDKLTNTIPAMSEKSLTERLPELSTGKLYSIKPEVLFNSLPNAPTEQLVGEEPPKPPPELPAPVVISTTPTEAKYRLAETAAGKWARVVGSPMPLDELLIKTKRSLKDVGTTVEISQELPADVATALSGEQIVSTYLSITFENATPADIELGHLTFKVEKAWLKQNSIHKWSVALSSYDPELGQWISLPSKRVKEDDLYVYYSAVITHFSKFAILGSQVVPTPEFKVANLAVAPTSIESGQKVTISADITNISNTAGTYGATLWIYNTIEAGKNVYLKAGETASVSFTVTGDVEGSYTVRVDRLFGSFVTKAAPVAPPAVGVPGWVWLIVGLVVVAVIVAVIWLVIRRRTA